MTTTPIFEYEPEAYNFDNDPGEEWPDYEPEAPLPRRGRPRYAHTTAAPLRRPQTYAPTPPPGGTVSRAELTRALQRVAGDIDRLKAGARASNGQINDLAD